MFQHLRNPTPLQMYIPDPNRNAEAHRNPSV